jgi:hypothetical protein
MKTAILNQSSKELADFLVKLNSQTPKQAQKTHHDC